MSQPATLPDPVAQVIEADRLKKFRVAIPGQSLEVVARDAEEAWAIFNDARQKWHSINKAGGKVEQLD